MMDEEEKKSIVPTEEPSVTPTEENQVNPVTTMTSHPAFVPVQDNAELLLDVSDLQTVPRKSSFGESDVSHPSTTSTMTHPTNQSVAAWLESTDGNASPIDRSPSLPSTLIDSAGVRDRRNSTVSTLCDQQSPSLISETFSSQPISYSSEMQRSHSFPLSDSVHLENDEPIEKPTNVKAEREEEEEDAPMQFFAVPESEESEVDRKVVRSPIFESRSPKHSTNVSFDATVPDEVPRKSSLPSRRRRRRESLNAPSTRTPPPLLRAKSHLGQNVASNTSPLHSQVLRKQFRATLSMPHGHWSSASEQNTRQFSRLSDEVFRSVSDASSKQFLGIPSSGSVLSSDPLASIISDIDGRSGIESSSLTENEPKMRVNPFMKKQRSLSHRASDSTPSTESLSSDSDDDSRSNFFLRKPRRFDPNADPKKTAMDKRRDVMNKLTWLVERKQTMLKRVALKFRNMLQENTLPARRSTTNPFVEFCSSFQSNNNAKALLRTEGEGNAATLCSLPAQPLLINTTESTGGGLINTDVWPSVSSLHSSLNLPKRRGSHRRAASGTAPSTRAENELERQISQPDEGFDSASPLARTLESILNEHLTMINTLLASTPANASFQNTLAPSVSRNEIYSRLVELSQKNPMHQRCSRIETKAFIDLISTFHMNRSHHYPSLVETVATTTSEHEEDQTFDGHLASDESSNTSSPSLTRLVSSEATKTLRDFRTLSPEFLVDCQKTEEELTKLFQKADQQHILYCLKHVGSGHSKDALVRFHRQLDALYVWYNLYYELTICIRKLSCLFRCRHCDDWPHLRIRSIATARERRAKRAEINDESSEDEDEELDEDVAEDDEENIDEEDETDESDDHRQIDEESEDEDDEVESDEAIDGDDDDLLPKSHWSEEPFDSFVELEDSNEKGKFQCYRKFISYMYERSYQVKSDGLARTLIERVAPVLFKTRLALLQTPSRSALKVEEILAGFSFKDVQTCAKPPAETLVNSNHPQEQGEKLLDTDNPPVNDNSTNIDIGESTVEQWLYHILKSSSTVQTICSSMDELTRENWAELHQQLGLPPLLPFYFFIVNVLLDVMMENLKMYKKPTMNEENAEMDSVSRQSLVREAKLLLRDALATRVYTLRMLDAFLPSRHLITDLREFDEFILGLYGHYRQYLSTVCVNRNYSLEADGHNSMTKNADFYYYVDEETSELIKEYYFSRDLTLTLNNQNEIPGLSVGFSNLIQQILTQLREDLNSKTEMYYQAFATDIADRSMSTDSSVELSPEFSLTNENAVDEPLSLADRTKKEIIDRTRIFRLDFDTIRQRTARVCELAKILIKDFSIAAEFKAFNPEELWQRLATHSYVEVKIEDTSDFDNFYVFVPPWLATAKEQVEKLLGIICSQQTPPFEADSSPPFMVFVPSKRFHQLMKRWNGDVLYIPANAMTQLSLNLTALESLHLVVNRDECWEAAVNKFYQHVGPMSIRSARRSARYEATRSAFEQLPETIDKLSVQITNLVLRLSKIWDQVATKFYLTDMVKSDERTIQSKLVDLILWIYKSGFLLFRQLYDLICLLSSNDQEMLKNFVCNMNEFYCEWCKCVTKKFNYISSQQARTGKNKVSRPKWLSPGLSFLGFLATTTHLQLLNDDDFDKLIHEVPLALQALCGNARSHQHSPTTKVRSSSTSSSSHLSRPRSHRRVGSGGRFTDLVPTATISPPTRIVNEISELEKRLEQKSRDRKIIGKLFFNPQISTSGSSSDPLTSLKSRNIAFAWRRGTRIGQGGAGVAFRAINCSNGSIVCMKEILLSSIASRSLPSTYPEKLRRIATEIDMIMTIEHPNIVRYFGIERYKRTIYICMEYCLSTVNEFLNDIRAFERRSHSKRKQSIRWNDSSDQENEQMNSGHRFTSSLDVNEHVRGFVKQLLLALMALHEKNIVHCDVKGDNIFIANENGRYIVKLGDFNLSHRLELESPSADGIDSRSTQKGTLYFKPPESEYVCKSDIWALGCTIIEMLTGKMPWTNVTRPPADQAYIQGQLLAKKGPPIPDGLQEQAREFIELCLKPDLEERKSARELLNEAYPRVRIGDT